jgi:PIN domain nuclease of toxin-antitoxin system
MEYLADTVTIIRYFSGAGKIGAQALRIMDEADEGQHVILVSALTLAEILYLSEKNRIGIGLEESLEIISHADNYQIADLTPAIVKEALSFSFPDIFDRLIIATARCQGAPIVTCDERIKSAGLVQVVWE